MDVLCCADAAAAHTQDEISPSQLRSLWDGVGKPLLRVGKGGVQVFCFSLAMMQHNDIAFKEAENMHSSCWVCVNSDRSESKFCMEEK